MTDFSASTLRALFLERYHDFCGQLKRRLGSEDLARDAMQETYLKIHESDVLPSVRNPAAYLFRTALNTAEDQRRRDARLLTGEESLALLHLADEAQDPARICEGRNDIAVLGQALTGLPVRTQQMLMAARVHGETHAQIAIRYGVSERMVAKELKRALDHCAVALARSSDASLSGDADD